MSAFYDLYETSDSNDAGEKQRYTCFLRNSPLMSVAFQ